MQVWASKRSSAVARLDCHRPQGLSSIEAESRCASDRLVGVVLQVGLHNLHLDRGVSPAARQLCKSRGRHALCAALPSLQTMPCALLNVLHAGSAIVLGTTLWQQGRLKCITDFWCALPVPIPRPTIGFKSASCLEAPCARHQRSHRLRRTRGCIQMHLEHSATILASLIDRPDSRKAVTSWHWQRCKCTSLLRSIVFCLA